MCVVGGKNLESNSRFQNGCVLWAKLARVSKFFDSNQTSHVRLYPTVTIFTFFEFVTVDTSVQSSEKCILAGHKNVIPRASATLIKEHQCTLFEILCSNFWYFFDSCRANTWLEQVVNQGSKSNKESEAMWHIQTLSAEKIWSCWDYLPLQAEKYVIS